MRIFLLLALFLAIGAVVFALQNPGYTDLQIGFYELHTSTALVLIVTLTFGAIIGSLSMLPGYMKKRKEVKHIKKTLRDVTEMKTINADAPLVKAPAYDQTDQNSMDSFPASDPQSSSSRSNHETA